MFISYNSSITKFPQNGDGHYEMPRPFKGNSQPNLSNNKKIATVHLQCLKKKFKANKQYFDHYKIFMEETINRANAEPASTTFEGQSGTCRITASIISDSRIN